MTRVRDFRCYSKFVLRCSGYEVIGWFSFWERFWSRLLQPRQYTANRGDVELAKALQSPYIITAMERLQSIDQLKAEELWRRLLVVKKPRDVTVADLSTYFPSTAQRLVHLAYLKTCHRGFYASESSGKK